MGGCGLVRYYYRESKYWHLFIHLHIFHYKHNIVNVKYGYLFNHYNHLIDL
jgi:hypothetical protein